MYGRYWQRLEELNRNPARSNQFGQPLIGVECRCYWVQVTAKIRSQADLLSAETVVARLSHLDACIDILGGTRSVWRRATPDDPISLVMAWGKDSPIEEIPPNLHSFLTRAKFGC